MSDGEVLVMTQQELLNLTVRVKQREQVNESVPNWALMLITKSPLKFNPNNGISNS